MCVILKTTKGNTYYIILYKEKRRCIRVTNFYLRRAIEISKRQEKQEILRLEPFWSTKRERSSWSREILRSQRKSVQGTRKQTLAARASHEYSREFLWDCTFIYDCRAMCDVCRGYLLGEYRKSCIRNDRETTVGADRK